MKQIGDGCSIDSDCSINFDRRCDTTMPGGYCTIPECEPDRCPNPALCVEFRSSQPRLARRFCVQPCKVNGDCRGGYQCVMPTIRGSTEACPPAAPDGTPPVCNRQLDTSPMRTDPAQGFCVPMAPVET